MLNPMLMSAGVALLAVFYYLQSAAPASGPVAPRIEALLLSSYHDYASNGWPFDVYGPISHDRRNMPRSGDPLGWIIVDTIDTLMIAYNYTESDDTRVDLLQKISRIENWVRDELSYDIDAEVNIFETTIRMLGGLLSAYHLSSELSIGQPQVYLDKAVDLGDRLARAFGQSQSPSLTPASTCTTAAPSRTTSTTARPQPPSSPLCNSSSSTCPPSRVTGNTGT